MLSSWIFWYSAVSGASCPRPQGLVGSNFTAWPSKPGVMITLHWPFQFGYFEASCATAIVASGNIISGMMTNEDRQGMHSLPQVRVIPAIARKTVVRAGKLPVVSSGPPKYRPGPWRLPPRDEETLSRLLTCGATVQKAFNTRVMVGEPPQRRGTARIRFLPTRNAPLPTLRCWH